MKSIKKIDSLVIAVPRHEINPLISQSYGELCKHESISSVLWGIDFFWEENFHPEICHIHWPEALFNWTEPNEGELNRLEVLLKSKKIKTKFVVTIHNFKPHDWSMTCSERLYRAVYEAADLIIHMGLYSQVYFESKYHVEAYQVIIPHPIYNTQLVPIDKDKARKKLNLDTSLNICLCFGKIRRQQEFDLLLNGYRFAKKSDGRLIVAGSRMDFKNTLFERVLSGLRRRVQVPDLILQNGYIDESEMLVLFSAVDLVIIPRFENLNSGNLALAFTFGNVVVAPDRGVVGQIAKSTGNPVFNPLDYKSLAHAIEDGFRLSEKCHGDYNRDLALREWNLNHIMNEHVSAYMDLVS